MQEYILQNIEVVDELYSCLGDNDDHHNFYLKLEYRYEDDKGTHKVTVPKVKFDIFDKVPKIQGNYLYDPERMCLRIDEYLNGLFEIFKGFVDKESGERVEAFFVDEVVGPRCIKKMTKKQIEDILGYNIEIVDDKDEYIETYMLP